MQFRDLQRQYEVLRPQIDEAVSRVLSSAHFIGGAEVRELEERLAKWVGRKHCVACGNGTDALQLVLMAWGIRPGDAVFVPDFTFFSTGEVVSALGAVPVFYDVCADTFNADAESLEKAIQAVKREGKLRPAAIAGVDLFGLPIDADALEAVARRHGLPLLEDAAQGFGGEYKGRRCCSFGNTSITSFFPAKPLGCYGDGGAIFTDSDEEEALLRSLCVHGKGATKYDNDRIGMNSRLDTIQAAVLLVKMDALETYELRDVNAVASWYDEILRDTEVITPTVPREWFSSWAQYTVRLRDREQRDRVQAAMKERGIPTMVYYPKPMHSQKAFGPESHVVGCPVTEMLSAQVLSLPLHPYMDRETVETVTSALQECL